MNTYRKTYPGRDYVAQSRVVHSGAKMNGLNRWSVQIMRKRSRYGGKDRRGFVLFLAAGHVRAEIGSR